MLIRDRYWRYQQWAQQQNISLQDWHEDNFKLLMRIVPSCLPQSDGMICQPAQKPALQVALSEVFKFTTEMQLSMRFDDEPSDLMVVRIYHDVKLAELRFANEFDRLYQQLGGRADSRLKAQRRYSLNCFFNKWLRHLIANGYARNDWQAIKPVAVVTG